ncbi:cyclase family protein [Phaeacidiphilus oryzae]|uniref:cyclase family protein n=1 Tax=Phaeacidiphilus oryzae TaxID=348818 RepID=UPI000563F7DD|nr:cyclase family protein [Phaeacidiphilus oryzae]
MRLFDLTHPVRTGMPVYPGDPEVALRPALTAARDGVNLLHVAMGSQSGTHVDAPYHVDDRWPRLDELPLERFLGPGVVVDARGLAPRTPIGREYFVRYGERLRKGVLVLVVTGWSEHWGSERYQAHPYLSRASAEYLVERGVQTVGVDAMSVDATPARELTAHRVLCGAGAVIAENLRGLDALCELPAEADLEIALLPLRLAGPRADGAPIRAIARVREAR